MVIVIRRIVSKASKILATSKSTTIKEKRILLAMGKDSGCLTYRIPKHPYDLRFNFSIDKQLLLKKQI